MDTSKGKDEQTAQILAFLLRCDAIKDCTPEDLSSACVVFSVTPAEIRRLCALPNSALRLIKDKTVDISQSFSSFIEKRLLNRSFISLLESQNYSSNDSTKHGLVKDCENVDGEIVKLGSKPAPTVAPTVARSNLHRQNYIHGEKPSNPPQGTECHHSAHDGSASKHLQRIENAHTETPEGILSKSLQRPEKFHIAAGAACVVEKGLISPANDINAQPKKKSRDPRSAPRFEKYTVDGEVGAGGYGTVYKVRGADGAVFAIKCPLEHTSNSCVRNEINMLERLRGKDNIIKFICEVNGKVNPRPEAGGGGDVDCPSILLEFIEHDKPEVLKKEITIDELRCYSSSLFNALAQLHRERILHLDVKPGNFLFSRSTKRGCLVDFNLARDESAKRLSTRRPERGPSSAGNNKAKTSERKKRSWVQVDRDPEQKDLAKQQDVAVLPLSKRSRKMIENDPQAAEKLKSISPSGTQSKQTSKLAASKEILQVNDTTAQQLGTNKNQQNILQGLKPNHRVLKFSKENGSGNPSRPPTQTVGVSVKVNPSKRVDAGVHTHQAAQPFSSKRFRPKVAAVCQPKKDGPCVGTKGYRAPEVLMRSTKQTTRVDIWSAGVSLLQLVTGKSPFPSSTTDGALKDIARLRGFSSMAKLAKSLGQRPRFLKVQDSYQGMSVKEWCEKYSRRTDLKGTVPSTLYNLIDRCLDVNPDTRITAEAASKHDFCSADTSEFSKHPNPS